MDLLKIINSSVKRLPENYGNLGIEAILLHIERAEKYWTLARSTNDETMFTDVIYRTNQAFEGALKEAYSILANKDPGKKTTFEIEKYLENNQILKDRVLTSLRNYRQEWRNPSTHNYKLFFTEQEALLAIASVSTFCIILLEQINSKINENLEKERAKKFTKEVLEKIGNYEQLPLQEKIASLLSQSYSFIELPNRYVMSDEFISLLSGFIEAVDPAISINSDVKLSESVGERADLILSSNNEKVVVEIKRGHRPNFYIQHAEQQLQRYLEISGIKNGILMIFDSNADKGRWYNKNKMQHTLFGFEELSNIIYVTPIET